MVPAKPESDVDCGQHRFWHRLKQAGTSLGDSKALLRHRDIRVLENYYTYYDTIELKTALDAAEQWVGIR